MTTMLTYVFKYDISGNIVHILHVLDMLSVYASMHVSMPEKTMEHPLWQQVHHFQEKYREHVAG